MRFDQLEHAIRAACEVADDTEIVIFGSQAILATYPDAPESLRASIEVDVQPLNRPEAIDRIDGALGEFSPFHAAFGFYVEGVSLEVAVLPCGWEERTVPVSHPVGTRGNTGLCVEVHDLAASKLAAWREKDREFVAVLLAEKMIDPVTLDKRLQDLPTGRIDSVFLESIRAWVRGIAEQVG